MTPKLQVAIDVADLPTAFSALVKVAPGVDVIECGTILILAEGLRAVREVRALYPMHTLLADVRIAEAGSLIARHCFEAGADWVSCVAGASLTTIEQVVNVASDHDGQVQVELGETYDRERARAWRSIGVDHVIVKRSRDREAAGDLTWGNQDLSRIGELSELGFTVSVTGGIVASDLEVFRGAPVGVVIAGRSIVQADDPPGALDHLRSVMREVWQ